MSNYSSGYSYGTMASSGSTIQLTIPDGQKPQKTPSGLLATRAVETKDGWLGQIVIDKEIVFETEPERHSEYAINAVNKRIVAVVRGLFAEPETPTVVEGGALEVSE